MATPLMNNIFQIAYVTNDLDRAAAQFVESQGTGDFLFMRDIPDSPIQIALAYAGDMMIELIKPLGDDLALYADWIRGVDGFALRHHHFGILVEDKATLAAIRDRHVTLGNPLAMEGELPGHLDFLYADTTASLGHYLEYIRLDEGGREMFAAIPGSPFAR